jgi:hypothetical protein
MKIHHADKEFMKTWLVLFLTALEVSQTVSAGFPGQLVFSYATLDGKTMLDCAYSANASGTSSSFQVVCGKGRLNPPLQFDVDWSVVQMTYQTQATYRVTFSILNSGRPSDGSTSYLTLNRDGALAQISLHQQIAGGQAELIAHYNAGL